MAKLTDGQRRCLIALDNAGALSFFALNKIGVRIRDADVLCGHRAVRTVGSGAQKTWEITGIGRTALSRGRL